MTEVREEQVFSGRLGEVVHLHQPDGRVFELFRRPPGVRMIFLKGGSVLMTEEYRSEIAGFDLRLPGGKVFDDLASYAAERAAGSFEESALRAVERESHEEVGLHVSQAELVAVAKAGATVDWDLYYYVVRDFTAAPDGPQPEDGEEIRTTWLTAPEILEAIRAGRMSEWRSVGVLLGLVLPREFPALFQS